MGPRRFSALVPVGTSRALDMVTRGTRVESPDTVVFHRYVAAATVRRHHVRDGERFRAAIVMGELSQRVFGSRGRGGGVGPVEARRGWR